MAVEFPVNANTKPAEKNINSLIESLRKMGKEAGKSDKEIDEITSSVKKMGTEGTNSVNNVNKSLNNFANDSVKKLGSALLAAFAFERLVEFGRKVISITAEFQKFEAVLRNTLGSNSAAQIALSNIQKFASQTPFSVQELTASFVKLANQGFIPTNEQMRKLGDLAASTGKQFDMLTEAIIDAQTGEFERLKEFGIRASKQGDQVTFTFKGVKTQVDFTSESIRQYVLSLGDAEGVSGAMAAISETLGGKISNLGDSWDMLLNTIGDGNKGALSGAASVLNDLIQSATQLIQTSEQSREAIANQITAEELEKFKEFAKSYGSLEEALEAYKVQIEKTSDTINGEYGKAVTDLLNNEITLKDRVMGNVQAKELQNKKLEESRKKLGAEWAAYQQVIPAIEDYIKAQKKIPDETPKALSLIQQLEKDLKDFKAAKESAFSEQEITFFNRRIEETEKTLKRLSNLGEDPKGIVLEPLEKMFKKLFGTPGADAIKSTLKSAKKEMKAFTDSYAEEQERLKKLELDRIEAVSEAKEFARETELNAINTLFDAHAQSLENEMALVEAQRQRELENAGENKEAQAAINKKFDERQRQLANKQANLQQQQALFNIVVSQGPAIAKTVGTLGFPAAIPFIVALGVLFTTLMSKQRSTPMPKFRDGVFDLDGDGTSTSDSIDARLSKHESVASAEVTSKFGDALKPMIENEFFEWSDLKKIVDRKVPSEYAVIVAGAKGADSPEMLEELRATRKALENLKQIHVDIDENGFKKWTREGDRWTEFVNDRYSS